MTPERSSEPSRPHLPEALRSLQSDPTGKGCSCLCRDGVWRNFDGQRKIVDAYRLSMVEIKQRLDRGPWDQVTEELFRGVGGRGVPDEQLFDPPKEVLPREKSAKEKAESRVIIERQKAEFRARAARGEVEDKSACGLKRSNYDLTPKA